MLNLTYRLSSYHSLIKYDISSPEMTERLWKIIHRLLVDDAPCYRGSIPWFAVLSYPGAKLPEIQRNDFTTSMQAEREHSHILPYTLVFFLKITLTRWCMEI